MEDFKEIKSLEEYGIVPILVECISPKFSQFAKLQTEASWCMCNILGVIDFDIKQIEEYKLIDYYSEMLNSDIGDIVDNVKRLY